MYEEWVCKCHWQSEMIIEPRTAGGGGRGGRAGTPLRKERKVGNSTILPENWFGLYGFVKRWTMHRYLLKFYKIKTKYERLIKVSMLNFHQCLDWWHLGGRGFRAVQTSPPSVVDPNVVAPYLLKFKSFWEEFFHCCISSYIYIFKIFSHTSYTPMISLWCDYNMHIQRNTFNRLIFYCTQREFAKILAHPSSSEI